MRAKKFTIEIEFGNEAMCDGEELAAALRRVATKVQPMRAPQDDDSGPIKDLNGSTVGMWAFEPEGGRK